MKQIDDLKIYLSSLHRAVLLLLLLLSLTTFTACMMDPSTVAIRGVSLAWIDRATMSDGKIHFQGNYLHGVSSIELLDAESGVRKPLIIESQSKNSLTLTASQEVTLALNRVLSLVITDSHGTSTHHIAFTLEDGAVQLRHLSTMGATKKGEVLVFDGTKWSVGNLGGLVYRGQWDATLGGDIPNIDLAPEDLLGGDYYIVNQAGTHDLNGGEGTDLWAVGDWAVWNEDWNSGDGRWEKIANALTTEGDPTVAAHVKDGVDVSEVKNGAGKYLTYKPDNTACLDGEVLAWSDNDSRWECHSPLVESDVDSMVANNNFIAHDGSDNITTNIVRLSGLAAVSGGTTTAPAPFVGECAAGSSIRAIAVDGSVTCENDSSAATQCNSDQYLAGDGICRTPTVLPTITNISSSYAVTTFDNNKMLLTSGTTTITLPAASNAGSGFRVTIKRIDATNVTTIKTVGSETIDGDAIRGLYSQYATIQLISNGSNWFIAYASGTIDISNLIQAITLKQSEGSIGSYSEGSTISIDLGAVSGVDGTVVSGIVASGLPNYLTLSSTGILSGTLPERLSPENISFSVNFTSFDRSKTASYWLTNDADDDAPVWGSNSPLPPATPDPYNLQLDSSDPEGASLTFQIISGSLPNGLSMNSQGEIIGTTQEPFDGTIFDFTVRASDGGHTSDKSLAIQRMVPIDVTTWHNFENSGTLTIPKYVSKVKLSAVGAGGAGACWGGRWGNGNRSGGSGANVIDGTVELNTSGGGTISISIGNPNGGVTTITGMGANVSLGGGGNSSGGSSNNNSISGVVGGTRNSRTNPTAGQFSEGGDRWTLVGYESKGAGGGSHWEMHCGSGTKGFARIQFISDF